MVDSNSESCENKSTRQRIFALLAKNSELTPRQICKELNLIYALQGAYVSNTKSLWKSNYHNEEGSSRSNVHFWSGWCNVPKYVDRLQAVSVGWKETNARNRWLQWKDCKLSGRMMWFETGRVNFYIVGTVNLGMAKQLVCNGFYQTGLIFNDKVLESVLETINHSSEHRVFDVGQPLPKKTIRYYNKTLGIKIKIGDKSHPNAVEVESHVPDWAERLTLSLEKIAEAFNYSEFEKDSAKKRDYLV
jgi:hypothetical protein